MSINTKGAISVKSKSTIKSLKDTKSVKSVKSVKKDYKETNDVTRSYVAKIQEQEDTIAELKQTIMLMESKLKKYEDMMAIKDDQINEMRLAMEHHGLL